MENNSFYPMGCLHRVGFYEAQPEGFEEYYTGFNYLAQEVEKWAYLEDLISASKALEASIQSLEIIRHLKPSFPIVCEASIGLNEVDRIMKGEN